MSPTRIVIADERRIVRWALGIALQSRGLDVVGEAGDLQELRHVLGSTQVEVALLHVALPPLGGVAACADVRRPEAASRVVLLSDATDPGVLVDAVEAGADGYLGAEASIDDCVEAIRSANAGVPWIPPAMLGLLLRDLIDRRRDQRSALDKVVDLSRREREILSLLAEGLGTKDIAEALVVSPNTARTHVQNVRRKLGVRSRAEAVAFAERYELVEKSTAWTEGETGD